MSDFFQTRMGQQYYESTMPALVKALERIAKVLEGKSQDKILHLKDNVLPDGVLSVKNGKKGRRHDD